ncbi:MAG: NADPH:quinone oxidoreductase family protein [Alphaproteobacteria bacterium]|nr:NADPH:quinone oxidoreductase family protein [Alphaproteobacteria bacterium]
MRAIVCPAFGDLSVLTPAEIAPPVAGPGQVRIAVRAAGVNFADQLLIAGTYQERHAPPFVPGFEVAGEILECGEGVEGLAPGDRVMAMQGVGGWAEQTVAAAADVLRIPDAMSFEMAAAFPVAYGTSHLGLLDRARLTAGEVLLVHGAAGGVGLTAVEIGKAAGALVIATAGGPDKLAVAVAHGADHGIDYRTEDVRARVMELTGGRGVDVVFDSVGGAIFDASLRCAAPDGRILVVGFASGKVPAPPANILLVKNLTVIGYWWGAYRRLRPQAVRDSLGQCLRWWEEGRLKPHVSRTLPLDRAAQALGLLKDRAATGKIVLIP